MGRCALSLPQPALATYSRIRENLRIHLLRPTPFHSCPMLSPAWVYTIFGDTIRQQMSGIRVGLGLVTENSSRSVDFSVSGAQPSRHNSSWLRRDLLLCTTSLSTHNAVTLSLRYFVPSVSFFSILPLPFALSILILFDLVWETKHTLVPSSHFDSWAGPFPLILSFRVPIFLGVAVAVQGRNQHSFQPPAGSNLLSRRRLRLLYSAFKATSRVC